MAISDQQIILQSKGFHFQSRQTIKETSTIHAFVGDLWPGKKKIRNFECRDKKNKRSLHCLSCESNSSLIVQSHTYHPPLAFLASSLIFLPNKNEPHTWPQIGSTSETISNSINHIAPYIFNHNMCAIDLQDFDTQIIYLFIIFCRGDCWYNQSLKFD